MPHGKCHTPRMFDPTVSQLIDNEWRLLPDYIFQNNEISGNDEIYVFWGKLLNYKDEMDILIFNNISRFVLNIITLPVSNATCERVFSKVNAIKTKSRNKLITKTVNGCLLASQCVIESGGGCINFMPTQKMLSSMTHQNLFPKKQSTITIRY